MRPGPPSSSYPLLLPRSPPFLHGSLLLVSHLTPRGVLTSSFRCLAQVRFDPNSQAPNKFDNIADYSSFGPTLDGRIKPDVVAPGTVASSASGSPCEVSVYRGTSMATPIVAGGALLVRQYFMEGYYPTGKPTEAHKHVPSGALVKAVIIGGATPLTGFTETGLPLAPTPSWRQGYGRVTLVKSLPLEGSAVGWRMQVVDGAKLATGESHQYCVRAAGGPMRITLVWHDLPSDVAAEKNLVNDLDLTVRAAGLQGMDLLGNGETDRLNNVEQVMLDEVTAGPVAINVMAHNVFAKFGPQPYSLVVHGVFNGALESSHNPASRDTSVSSSASCVVLVASITIGPDMITRSRDPEFTFNTRSGEVPVQGFECLLGRGDGEGAARGPDGTHTWRACESPTRYTGLRDGPYTFTVRARGEEVEDSHPFLIDTTAPTVAFYKRPPVITSSQMAEVQFTAEDTTSVRLECMLESLTGGGGQQVDNRNGRVELGEWTPCTSPQQLQHIGVGEWRFTVRAKDAVGNQAAPEKIEWLVELDRNKVYTRLLSGPAGLVNGKEVGFEFQALRALGEEEGVPQEQHRFQCILEERHGSLWESAEPFSKGWEACESPWRQSGIPDGEYRFSAMIQGGDLSKPVSFTVSRPLPSCPFSWLGSPRPPPRAFTFSISFFTLHCLNLLQRLVAAGDACSHGVYDRLAAP